MATISITVPSGILNRVLDAVAANHNYTGFEADGITPLTKQEFARRYIISVIKADVVGYEAQQAAYAASATAITNANSQIIIT